LVKTSVSKKKETFCTNSGQKLTENNRNNNDGCELTSAKAVCEAKKSFSIGINEKKIIFFLLIRESGK
jgi:hypothetical protein